VLLSRRWTLQALGCYSVRDVPWDWDGVTTDHKLHWFRKRSWDHTPELRERRQCARV